MHIHKVHAHSSITGNKIADTLANKGTLIEKLTAIPHIHIAHYFLLVKVPPHSTLAKSGF